MQRRQFISLSALVGLATVVPVSLQAIDFRQTKANAWTAHTVDDAIREMYGNITLIEEGVSLNLPKIASNGASVPLDISSDLSAKSLAVFQNANPESAVIAYTIHENNIIDYSLKIKMQEGLREVTVIVEGRDGKFYSAKKTLVVSPGGCDG